MYTVKFYKRRKYREKIFNSLNKATAFADKVRGILAV